MNIRQLEKTPTIVQKNNFISENKKIVNIKMKHCMLIMIIIVFFLLISNNNERAEFRTGGKARGGGGRKDPISKTGSRIQMGRKDVKREKPNGWWTNMLEDNSSNAIGGFTARNKWFVGAVDDHSRKALDHQSRKAMDNHSRVMGGLTGFVSGSWV